MVDQHLPEPAQTQGQRDEVWQRALQAALHAPAIAAAASTAPPQHPLPALLFLMDGLAMLDCLKHQRDAAVEMETAAAAEEDEEQGASDDDNKDGSGEQLMASKDGITAFLAYLDEMYVAESDEDDDGSTARQPFRLDPSIFPATCNLTSYSAHPFSAAASRARSPSAPTPTPTPTPTLPLDMGDDDGSGSAEFEAELREACREALVWLRAYTTPHGEPLFVPARPSLHSQDDHGPDAGIALTFLTPTSTSDQADEALPAAEKSVERDEQARLTKASAASGGSLDILDGIPFEVHRLASSSLPSTPPASSPDSVLAFLAALDLPAPPAIDFALLTSITQALSDSARQASAATVTHESEPHQPSHSIGLARWTLATLLQHYLGPSFGQRVLPLGQATYADAEHDDAAVRAYFSRPKAHSASSSLLAFSPSRSDGLAAAKNAMNMDNDAASISNLSMAPSTASTALDPAGDAEFLAAKRDDKLRWLFGEAVDSRRANPLPPPSVAGTVPYPPSLAPVHRLPALMPGLEEKEEVRREGIDMNELGEAVLGLRVSTGRPLPGQQASYHPRAPLSPPHRRAYSTGTALDHLQSQHQQHQSNPNASSPPRRDFTASSRRVSGRLSNGSQAGPSSSKTSFDDLASLASSTAGGSPGSRGEYQGGASLGRIDSISTCDSQTRLLKHSLDSSRRRSYSAVLARQTLPTVDASPELPGGGSGSGKGSLSPNPFTSLLDASGWPKDIAIARDMHIALDGAQASLPINSNTLSAEEKKTLVRQSRKLRAVLGTDVQHLTSVYAGAGTQSGGASKQSHTNTQTHMDRQRSSLEHSGEGEDYETASSTFNSPHLHGDLDDELASSASLSRDSSRMPGHRSGAYTDTFTSPDLALRPARLPKKQAAHDDDDAHVAEALSDPPWSPASMDSASSSPAPGFTKEFPMSPEAAAKEARRKKLMKVQAFLGERVPPSALLPQAVPPIPSSSDKTPTNTKRSKTPKLISRASSKLGDKLGKARPASAAPSGGGYASHDERTLQRPESRYMARAVSSDEARERDPLLLLEEWQTLVPEPQAGTRYEPVRAATVTSGAEPTIAAVRRARKLEKVFGALPPQQLYRARRPTSQLAPLPVKKKLIARDDRHYSYDPHTAYGAAVSLYQQQHQQQYQTLRAIRTRSSNSSLYRSSIASLRYIVESGDDQLLNDFANVVLAEESESSDTENRAPPPAPPAGRPIGSKSSEGRMHVLGEDSDEEEEQDSSVERDNADGRSDHGDASNEDEEGHFVSRLVATRRRSQLSLKGQKGKEGKTEEVLRANEAFGRASDETTGSSPIYRDSNLSFAAASAAFGTRGTHPGVHLHSHLGRPASRVTHNGRSESVLSGQTVFSSADSAFDLGGGSVRSASRASSSQSRSSMESVRIQFKRAHKLAHMFGTTRGEVFNRVLDDIVADIQELDEDEDLSEEERRDVLENVAALRAAL